MGYQKFLLVICQAILLIVGPVCYAGSDVEDTEVDMEALLNDSEAVQQASQADKIQAQKEAEQEQRLRDQQKSVAEKAEITRRQASKEMDINESKIQALKAREAELRAKIHRSQAEISSFNNAAQKSRARLANENAQMQKLTLDAQNSAKLLQEAQQEYSKALQKEKDTAKQLSLLRAQTRRDNAKNQSQVAHIKTLFNQSVARTRAMDQQLLKYPRNPSSQPQGQ